MNKQSIKIVGISSEAVIGRLKHSPDLTFRVLPNEKVLFCDFSEYDISIGQVFTEVINPELHIVESNCKIVLKEVTQEFLRPYTSIPRGHKTISKFEFITSKGLELVDLLPKIENWYESESYLLLNFVVP